MNDYDLIREWVGLFTEPDHNDPRTARNRWLRRQRVMAVHGMSPGEHAALFVAQREFAPEVSCFDSGAFLKTDETVTGVTTH